MSTLTNSSRSPSAPAEMTTANVGILGARGYVGRELVRLILAHPHLNLAFATSDSGAGKPIADTIPGAPHDLRFIETESAMEDLDAADVLILALPNGAAEEVVKNSAAPRLTIDISADHRFHQDWTYGLAETFGEDIRTASRIANPGCYATAMHLALRPLADLGVASAHCFGVSGYSGAGATPNDRNDPNTLRDNILPYALANHGHEREASHHLGMPVRFAPSVAPFFRGLMVTALVTLNEPIDTDALGEHFVQHYADAPFVRALNAETPSLHNVVNTPYADIGLLTVDRNDPRQVAVVCAIDNLMKGAASQAIQNINLALGLAPTDGLLP